MLVLFRGFVDLISIFFKNIFLLPKLLLKTISKKSSKLQFSGLFWASFCPQFVAVNDYFYASTFSYLAEFSAIWQQCLTLPNCPAPNPCRHINNNNISHYFVAPEDREPSAMLGEYFVLIFSNKLQKSKSKRI